MKAVYAVACWDQYYPLADNVVKVFSNNEDAKEYILKMLKEDKYLPDYTDIFEYEVE